jgi:hypothetical protein
MISMATMMIVSPRKLIQHLVGEIWIYTPQVNSNTFNCKDMAPPVVVNIEIFDIGQE